LNEVTPSKFAALSPLVSNSVGSSSLANTIMQRSAEEIERLICTAQGNRNFPVCLIGGLARVIIPMLCADVRSQIVTAKGNAIDGAIFIGERLGEQISG
jgi:hypothetical protein